MTTAAIEINAKETLNFSRKWLEDIFDPYRAGGKQCHVKYLLVFLQLDINAVHCLDSQDPFEAIMSKVAMIYSVCLSIGREDFTCDVLLPTASKELILKKNEVTNVIQLTPPVEDKVQDNVTPLATFEHGCVGGTFDRLHEGHKLLLSGVALVTTKRVVVGISDGPLLANKKYKELLQSFEDREKAVVDYINLQNPNLNVEIHRLHDPAGPAATDPLLQVIVVSQETLAGLKVVNEQREANKVSPLASRCVPLIETPPGLSEFSSDTKISSTALRARDFKLQVTEKKAE